MTTRNWICGLAILGAAVLHCQQGTIGGPTAGFVFDSSSHALRAIRGIPGASLIGDPLDFGFPPAWVSVSPAMDSAVVADQAGSVRLFQLSGGKLAEVAVDALAGGQKVVFSPSGTAAALFGGGSVQVLKGLPGAPAIAGTLSLGSNLATSISTASLGKTRRSTGEPLAVSDDGGYVLLVSGGALRVLALAGDNRSLTDATAGTLAAFAPGGHDAAVVDPETGLAVIRDIAGTSTRQPLSAAPLPLPRAIAFSPDGSKIILASTAAPNVTVFDAATGAAKALACDCTPSGLARMGDVFRLNELESGPLWLLDARPADPRLLFVPAMQR